MPCIYAGFIAETFSISQHKYGIKNVNYLYGINNSKRFGMIPEEYLLKIISRLCSLLDKREATETLFIIANDERYDERCKTA